MWQNSSTMLVALCAKGCSGGQHHPCHRPQKSKTHLAFSNPSLLFLFQNAKSGISIFQGSKSMNMRLLWGGPIHMEARSTHPFFGGRKVQKNQRLGLGGGEAAASEAVLRQRKHGGVVALLEWLSHSPGQGKAAAAKPPSSSPGTLFCKLRRTPNGEKYCIFRTSMHRAIECPLGRAVQGGSFRCSSVKTGAGVVH